jgi:hypothetical protein
MVFMAGFLLLLGLLITRPARRYFLSQGSGASAGVLCRPVPAPHSAILQEFARSIERRTNGAGVVMNVVKKHSGKMKGSSGGLCLSLLVLLVLLILPGLVLA